jgi:hypothetical protein
MATLAQKLPYTHAFSGGAQWGGHQRLPSDPDALDYLSRLAAVEGAVEVGIAMAVENFIKGCKADGIWDAIKASCILCGARTLAGALVPLVGGAPSNNNFLPEDYNRETGLKGNRSTKYLDSNRANNADPQNDAHLSVYYSALRSIFNVTEVFAAALGTNARLLYGASPGDTYIRANGGGDYVAYGEQTGLIGCSRNNSATFDAFANGALAVKAATSGSPVGGTIHIFARPGASPIPTDARLAFYSIGTAISDLSLLDARVSALIQRIQLSLSTGLDASGYDDATVAYLLAAYNNGATLA